MRLFEILDDDDIIEKGDECLFKHSWIKVGEAAIGEKVFGAIVRRKAKPWCSMCGVELDGVYYDIYNQILKDLNK